MTRARLGQNFLVDENWQKKIASYFETAHEFGEIGPGHGELTKHLLNRYSGFTVFEKDRELIEFHKLQKGYQTIGGDFLDWNFELHSKPVEKFSFVGNLPYESGSAIVMRLCERAEQVEGFVFLLQKEVVERICSKAHRKSYSSFSVLVQGQYDVEALDIIGPEFFNPPPKVQSQIVRGKRRLAHHHPQTEKYRKFLQSSFQTKRKTFRNALKGMYPASRLDAVFQKFNFSPTVRAEELEVDMWPQLFKELVGE